MYISIGKNPKYQIVRHLSAIWDIKKNKEQEFIKIQKGDTLINFNFDIKKIIQKKYHKSVDSNVCIIDCTNSVNFMSKNPVLKLYLISSSNAKDGDLFFVFPNYQNINKSYLYLNSEIELDQELLREKLSNDVEINIDGNLVDIDDGLDMNNIQKNVILSVSSGKWFLVSRDNKNYRILFVHDVDMRDHPRLVAKCKCGFEIKGKATSKTYMTSFDIPNGKTVNEVILDAEL